MKNEMTLLLAAVDSLKKAETPTKRISILLSMLRTIGCLIAEEAQEEDTYSPPQCVPISPVTTTTQKPQFYVVVVSGKKAKYTLYLSQHNTKTAYIHTAKHFYDIQGASLEASLWVKGRVEPIF